MWPILLNTWNTSTLFVKKAAVSFLATYLYSLGQCGKDEKLNGVLEVSGLTSKQNVSKMQLSN